MTETPRSAHEAAELRGEIILFADGLARQFTGRSLAEFYADDSPARAEIERVLARARAEEVERVVARAACTCSPRQGLLPDCPMHGIDAADSPYRAEEWRSGIKEEQ